MAGRCFLYLIPNPQSSGSVWTRCSFQRVCLARTEPKSSTAQNPIGNVHCEALQMPLSPPEPVWVAEQRVECSRRAGCIRTGCQKVIVIHHIPSSQLSSSDRVVTIVALITTSLGTDPLDFWISLGYLHLMLIFNFTPTDLPSLSKITPALSNAPRMAMRFAGVVLRTDTSKCFFVDSPSPEAAAKSASFQFNKPRAPRDCWAEIGISCFLP